MTDKKLSSTRKTPKAVASKAVASKKATPKVAPIKASAPKAPGKPLEFKALKKSLEQTQDQISLLHGVLEELCERQEALAAWQMEFSKRLVTLSEAQWRALEDVAGTNLGHPVERLFGAEHPIKDYTEVDALDEAGDYFDSMSKDLNDRRINRRERVSKLLTPGKKRNAKEAESPEVPESILVLPSKPEVH